MKKLVSLLLVAAFVFGLAAPISVAVEEKLPVIYIVGKQNTPVYKIDEKGNFLLDENGNRIQVDDVNRPLGMERGDYILSQVEPVVSELAMALVTDDYSDYIDTLVEAFAAPYKDAVLDKDGTSSTTAIDPNVNDLSLATSGAGGYKYYFFRYDWRYSPYETADLLNDYIEAVCTKEKVDKVNMHARCYGSNVAMAYIAKALQYKDGEHDNAAYNHPFRINNLALNTTPIAGYYVVGALMSGSIKFDADVIDRYISLYLAGDDIFEDPTLEMLAVTLISVMNQIKLLGLGLDKVQEIYDKVADELVPRLALVSYGTFPSYWSMIGDNYFDKAKMMVFKTLEAEGEYAQFIEKINNYHNLLGDIDENGKAGYAKVLEKACSDKYGMKTCILAKYGYQTFPFFEGCDLSGDGRGTVTELSLGGLGNVIDETFTEKELAEIKALEDYDERYLSPDKQVYAGTCLFPETTWFSRNLGHSQLHEIDPIVTEFFRTNGKLTAVGENSLEKFPQFFEYERATGKFIEVESVDNNDASGDNSGSDNSGTSSPVWSDNPFLVFIRFFRALFEFITARLKK